MEKEKQQSAKALRNRGGAIEHTAQPAAGVVAVSLDEMPTVPTAPPADAAPPPRQPEQDKKPPPPPIIRGFQPLTHTRGHRE